MKARIKATGEVLEVIGGGIYLEGKGSSPVGIHEVELLNDNTTGWIPLEYTIKEAVKEVITDAKRGWKPSKEQLQVMAKAVVYFEDSWVSKDQKILQSLYNDLQKL